MKLNRNDLCHCGSGKKYKKCHLVLDQARGREERSLKTLAEWVRFHLRSLDEGVQPAALAQEAVQAALAPLGEADPAVALVRQIALCDVAVGDAPLIAGASVGDTTQPARREALREAMQASWTSLFEVTECKRGKGVRLADRLADQVYWVGDPALAETLEPLEVVVGRLLRFENKAVLLDGFEKVWFRGRKAAIADLLAELGAVAAVEPSTEESPEEGPPEEGAPEEAAAEDGVEAVDDAETAGAETAASSEAVEARRALLKSNAARIVRRARAAHP